MYKRAASDRLITQRGQWVVDKSCPSCGERKSATAYGRNRTQPDGLSFYCLACNRARNQATYARKQARRGRTVRDLSWVPEGFRWCPTCQQAVPEAQYVLSRRTASGFGSQCKPCHRRASNDSYWARRYGMTKNQVAELRAAKDDR